MISVEHMDELITRFKSGELDIRDIIEQSYFGGRANAMEIFDEVLEQLRLRRDYYEGKNHTLFVEDNAIISIIESLMEEGDSE